MLGEFGLTVLPVATVRQRSGAPYAELVRWAFGLSTAGIITAGAIYVVKTNPGDFDPNFYGLLLTALLPSLVYLLAVRDPRSTMLCGASLLGVTLLGWIFVLDDDPLRGVGAVLAFPITMAISTGFAMHDRANPAIRS